MTNRRVCMCLFFSYYACIYYPFFMKKFLSFWLLFAVLFFSTVAICYSAHVDPQIVIGLLLALYFSFQAFSLWQAYKYGRDWILASIILQAILAMCSPLYFSNF